MAQALSRYPDMVHAQDSVSELRYDYKDLATITMRTCCYHYICINRSISHIVNRNLDSIVNAIRSRENLNLGRH